MTDPTGQNGPSGSVPPTSDGNGSPEGTASPAAQNAAPDQSSAPDQPATATENGTGQQSSNGAAPQAPSAGEPAAPGAYPPPSADAQQSFGQQAPYGQQAPSQQPAQPLQGQPYAAPGQPYPGGSYGAQPPAGQPPRKGMRPWAWWLIGGGAALVVIIVVAVVVAVVVSANSGAKPVADQYLSAISKGDAKAANQLARVDTSDEKDALLTKGVLSNAVKHITDAKVTKLASSRSSDLTYATVTYELGGKAYHSQIELDKDSKGWYVRQGLTFNLPVSTAASAASDAGYTLKGGDVAITTDNYDVVAYPGVYRAEAPNEFFTLSDDVQVTVAPDAATTLKDLKLTPSKAYIDDVQKQVDAHFDKCAAMTDYYDIEDCGIELGFPDNVMITGAKVAVKVGEYPEVEVNDSDDYNLFKLGDGSISATITGSTYDGGTGSEQIEAGAGYTSADISIKDGKVVVDFD